MSNKVYEVIIKYKDVYAFRAMTVKKYKLTIMCADEVEARTTTVAKFLANGYDISDIIAIDISDVTEDGDLLTPDTEVII